MVPGTIKCGEREQGYDQALSHIGRSVPQFDFMPPRREDNGRIQDIGPHCLHFFPVNISGPSGAVGDSKLHDLVLRRFGRPRDPLSADADVPEFVLPDRADAGLIGIHGNRPKLYEIIGIPAPIGEGQPDPVFARRAYAQIIGNALAHYRPVVGEICHLSVFGHAETFFLIPSDSVDAPRVGTHDPDPPDLKIDLSIIRNIRSQVDGRFGTVR